MHTTQLFSLFLLTLFGGEPCQSKFNHIHNKTQSLGNTIHTMLHSGSPKGLKPGVCAPLTRNTTLASTNCKEDHFCANRAHTVVFTVVFW